MGRAVFDFADPISSDPAKLAGRGYSAVICDASVDRWAASDFLRELRARDPRLPFLVITDRDSTLGAQRAQTLGHCITLTKSELSVSMLESVWRRIRHVPQRTESATPLDVLPVMIWRTNERGAFTDFSKRWMAFTGRSEEKEKGLGWTEGIHPDDLETWVKGFSTALAARREFLIDVRIRIANGSYRWVRHAGVPCADKSDGFTGYLGTSYDVTDLKQSAHEAHQEMALLRRKQQDLEQFPEIAAHDLAQPLMATESCLSALSERGDLDEALMGAAVDNIRRVQRMLRDLVDCSRAGNEPLPDVVASTGESLTLAISNLRPLIQTTGAHITYDALPDVRGDTVQLARVFQNLVGNALKYAVVPVEVHIGAIERGKQFLFQVRDNGPGIPENSREEVFQIFRRLDPLRSSGRGIGLTICRRIVERHGGRIWVDSKAGEGAAFYFTLLKAV